MATDSIMVDRHIANDRTISKLTIHKILTPEQLNQQIFEIVQDIKYKAILSTPTIKQQRLNFSQGIQALYGTIEDITDAILEHDLS